MDCDILQKIELLHAAGTQFNPPNAREVIKTLYDILTILDGKGLALLALAGAALCLGVAEISYPFLHYVGCSTDKLDYSVEIAHLTTLVTWRTAYYQIAWRS